MEIDAVLEVEAGDPQIAIDFLLANINLSKSRLKDLMHKGGVWRVNLDGDRERLRRAMTDILVGEQIEIFYDQALIESRPLRPELLSDEGQYSVWSKPAGIPLEGSDFGDFHSFQRAIELAFAPPREPVWLSAFDYQASGITLLAHTRKAASDLTGQFNPDGFSKDVQLHYRVEVVGNFPELSELASEVDGKPAKAKVSKVRFDARPNRSVLDIWPETGRADQIRCQLADIGYPVVGDDQYGSDDEYEGLRLKVMDISFVSPVSGQKQQFSLRK